MVTFFLILLLLWFFVIFEIWKNLRPEMRQGGPVTKETKYWRSFLYLEQDVWLTARGLLHSFQILAVNGKNYVHNLI